VDQAGVSAPSESYDVFGSRAEPAKTGEGEGYVVDGKRYPRWTDIPSSYRVPVERHDPGPQPGITVFQF
jgi:hypothetical protein